MFKQWLMKQEVFDSEHDDPIEDEIEKEKQDGTFVQTPLPRQKLAPLEVKIKQLFKSLREIDPDFAYRLLNHVYSPKGSKLKQDIESMLQKNPAHVVAQNIVDIYTAPDVNQK